MAQKATGISRIKRCFVQVPYCLLRRPKPDNVGEGDRAYGKRKKHPTLIGARCYAWGVGGKELGVQESKIYQQ